MHGRPPWSRRRRRLLVVLAVGALIGGLLAAAIPNQYGVTAGFLAALCAFLLLAATGVFVVVPGQDTLGTLLRSVPLAGAALVVAVLVLLSTPADLRWLWSVAAAAAAGWTVAAVWRTRRSGA